MFRRIFEAMPANLSVSSRVERMSQQVATAQGLAEGLVERRFGKGKGPGRRVLWVWKGVEQNACQD